MTITSLIPPQYRLAAALTLVVTLCLASAAVGAVVATWRADAGHAAEVAALQRELSDLKLATANQNAAVDVLQAKTEAAEQASDAAQRRLAQAMDLARLRIDEIDGITAKNCAGVLRQYWGMRP